MKKTSSGFTIVELLIVIVVIAILAAITIVTYNSVQTRADNAVRVAELRAWEKHFRLYEAMNGRWPAMSNGQYCLGSDFPIGAGGVARCRDYNSTGTGVLQSGNTTLMNELRTVGTLPQGARKPVAGVGIGPHVDFSSTRITLTGVFAGSSASDCPDGTLSAWTSTTRVHCSIRIDL